MSFWAKKLDGANAARDPKELERMAADRRLTHNQRMSAKRVLKEGKK